MKAFDPQVSFISFVRLSCFGFSDSGEVASLALSTSVHIPGNVLLRRLKWWMLWCQYNWARRYFECNRDTVAICWNGLNSSRRAFVEGARRSGAGTVFFELSPFNGRVTIDAKGVNFLNSLPRSADFYTRWQSLNPEESGRWMNIRDSIVSRRLSKNINVQQVMADVPLCERPYIFVPLQVQSDSQIRLFGGLVQSMTHFVQTLDEYVSNLPMGWTLRIKEHPTSKTPYRLSEIITHRDRIVIDNTTDTIQLVKFSEAVVTVNSSVGLEALFFEKPVLVMGQAFYGFDRIAVSLRSVTDLKVIFSDPVRHLVFDQAAATAFLNYLVCVYYPKVNFSDGGAFFEDVRWLNEFKDAL